MSSLCLILHTADDEKVKKEMVKLPLSVLVLHPYMGKNNGSTVSISKSMFLKQLNMQHAPTKSLCSSEKATFEFLLPFCSQIALHLAHE